MVAPLTVEDANNAYTDKSSRSVVKRKKRKRFIILIIVLLLVLAALLVMLLSHCVDKEPSHISVMPDVDVNASDIHSREELIDAMQDFADASYFTLQINPEASMTASTGEATFEIANPAENIYPISVQLVLEDGSLLYESGAIMPNQLIRKITASKTLTPGVYMATAKVVIYNPNDQTKEGETEAKIHLTVN